MEIILPSEKDDLAWLIALNRKFQREMDNYDRECRLIIIFLGLFVTDCILLMIGAK